MVEEQSILRFANAGSAGGILMVLQYTTRLASDFSPTLGASETAEKVARLLSEQRRRAEDAISLRFDVGQARRNLFALAEECGEPGWDGEAALPVDRASIEWALRLLDGLPNDLPAPTIGLDPDGQVTLEWYARPDRVLSVSLDPRGLAHYAALYGIRRKFGTEPVGRDLPAIIHQIASDTVIA